MFFEAFIMLDPLLGPRIKIERAREHLVAIRHLEREFFDTNSCKIVYDEVSRPGVKLAKIVLEARPPEIIHVLVGELIYQLRSALDQTAVAFARASAKNTRIKEVYFPTGDNFRSFIAACRKSPGSKKRLSGALRYMDFDLRRSILRTRNYDGENDILRGVFRLANVDKHLELIAVGAHGHISKMNDFTFRNVMRGFIADGLYHNLKDGIIFSELLSDGSIEKNNSQASIHISGLIMLSNLPPYSDIPLIDNLEAMVMAV
jgi:hypothetical protein